MNEEMRALEKNQTWEIVELLKRKRPIECKWVFTITYKANGTLERYKARLVVKGYTQTYGADFLGIDLHPCSENEYNWCVIIFGS